MGQNNSNDNDGKKRSSNGNNNLTQLSRPHNLSIWLRLYIYGLHGYFIEVGFTAIFDFIFSISKDWKFIGQSSIWSFIIFGTYGIVQEKLSVYLRSNRVPVLVRGLIYLLTTYFWEYTSGTLLTLFDACPWDYKEFQYNIGGLITLEYAPFWLTGALISERILMGRLEQLQWVEDGSLKEDGKKVKTK